MQPQFLDWISEQWKKKKSSGQLVSLNKVSRLVNSIVSTLIA